MNQFALGQNFIRDYSMLFNWVTRQSGDTTLQIYVGPANYKESKFDTTVSIYLTIIALLVYLSYFTVLKFQRLSREESEF